jgi:tetratricopeptide (TPR) repeat protein
VEGLPWSRFVPRWLALVCLLGACVQLEAASTQAPPPLANAQMQRWLDDRARLRAGRAGLTQDAARDQLERGQKALKIALEVVAKAKDNRVPGQDALFVRMGAFITRLDPTLATTLSDAAQALDKEPASADPKAVRAWATYVDPKRALFVQPTERLGQRALDLGVYDIAHDCLDQVLTFDPDHPGLRHGLNLTKSGDRWYGPKDIEVVKAGFTWDDSLGWVLAKERARYERGDYYDLQERRWGTLEAADQLHAARDKPWLLRTEHLDIRGNASLKQLVDVGNRLETFYGEIFASYSSFFAKDRSDVKLIFGMLDHDRLAVSVARNQEDYRASLPSGVDAGWSAGMWIPAANSSFFYAGHQEVVYHEFTHQVLHVFSHMNNGPAWLVEGVAVYSQSPRFENGGMRLGILSENRQVMRYFTQRTAGRALTLEQIMALTDSVAWGAAAEPDLNYAAAGALVECCMEDHARAYRADFIDFLRDSYLGQTMGHSLSDYMGISHDALHDIFEHWVATAQVH